MYKMIIVDDEYLVRMGIKETINWESINVEIVGEAQNGLKAFEMVNNLKPDIIISDVKMPLLNGIELVKKLRNNNFEGEIIILSGYRDFDYARDAFENGIFSYVLKPVDNEELLEVVKKAIAHLNSKKKVGLIHQNVHDIMPKLRLEAIKNILYYPLKNEEIEEKIKLYDLSINKSGYVAIFVFEENQKTNIEDFKKLLSYINLNKDQSYYIFDNELVVFIGDELIEFKKKTKTAFILYEKDNIHVMTGGIGKKYQSLSEINNSYLTAKNVLNNKLLLGLNMLYTYEKEKDKKYNKNIYAILQIISIHYKDNLTVKKVADMLLVSESYILHLFKEQLGKTFNDVLTKYRITVAKKLLLNGSYRINEIALMIGYKDSKYFNSVFKKETNKTPSQYIAEHEIL